eukprot:gene14656-1209_t
MCNRARGRLLEEGMKVINDRKGKPLPDIAADRSFPAATIDS